MKSQHIIFSILLLLYLAMISFAQDRVYSVNTIAGKLEVKSTMGTLGCSIKLNKKVIVYDETCDFSPQILKHSKTTVSPFSEVIVFQNQMLGNACDGTDIFIIGIKKNKEYRVSDSIEYCGGPKPVVAVFADKIVVTLPRHEVNRGTGYIAKEVWIYKNERLEQLKQPRKKRRR